MNDRVGPSVLLLKFLRVATGYLGLLDSCFSRTTQPRRGDTKAQCPTRSFCLSSQELEGLTVGAGPLSDAGGSSIVASK